MAICSALSRTSARTGTTVLAAGAAALLMFSLTSCSADTADAAGNDAAGVRFAEDSEVAKSDRVKVMAETMVPGAPIVVSDTLPAELKTQLTEVLGEVTIDDIIASGVTSADTQAFRDTFFATEPVDDQHYDTIRDICVKTSASQCQG
ncbi:hypothetical protein [Cryobacterium sp. Hb1]|uniref:hypothetical protein n=1 Tax=Cryobacterium sp. Hb1 TaxID=1259147 RepID=UPI00106D448F|nr:hypothetical protein [Cryobacterium sp. Hb1]TFD71089.1 hypothetical protein E3T38_04360 [Cryobacterium sp. Hb1]